MVNRLVRVTDVVNILILPLLSSRIDRVPKNNLRSLLPAFGAYSCPIILIQQGGYIKAMYSPINYTIWTIVQLGERLGTVMLVNRHTRVNLEMTWILALCMPAENHMPTAFTSSPLMIL